LTTVVLTIKTGDEIIIWSTTGYLPFILDELAACSAVCQRRPAAW